MATGRSPAAWSGAILLALLLGTAPPPAAAADSAARCTAAKLAAASKKHGAKIRCHQQAIRLQQPVESACLAAAEARFVAAFAHAEAYGGCTITGDAPAVEGAVDACVDDLLVLLSPFPPTTTTTLPPSHSCSPLFTSCGGCPSCICFGIPEFGPNGICLVPTQGGQSCGIDPPVPCPPGQACVVTSLTPFVQMLCAVPCP